MVKIWQLQGIPIKLTRLKRMIVEDFQARVVTGNNMTESINVYVGVRQGDALSVVLFLFSTGLYSKEIRYQGKCIN